MIGLGSDENTTEMEVAPRYTMLEMLALLTLLALLTWFTLMTLFTIILLVSFSVELDILPHIDKY